MKECTVRISDMSLNKGVPVLSFDLEDILKVINGNGEKYLYTIEYLEEVLIRQEKINLEKGIFFGADFRRVNITFDELLKLSNVFIQIDTCKIVGKYEDYRLIIEILDASFWEVKTVEQDIITALKIHFSNIKMY